MYSLPEFWDVCQSLASSAGELASLVVVVLVSYLLVVVRSLRARLATNLTRSRSVSAPALRASRGQRGRPSSSAPLTAGAARHPPSPSGANDYGLPQADEISTSVERFIQSATAHDASPDVLAIGRREPHDQDSVGRAAGGEQRRSDSDWPGDGGGAATPGGVLGPKRG